MPIKIDCLKCEGKTCKSGGECDWSGRDCTPIDNCGEFIPIICQNPDCIHGKITVYTQAELNQAVKKEREACAFICQGIGDKRVKSSWRVGEQCAEAIRNKEGE